MLCVLLFAGARKVCVWSEQVKCEFVFVAVVDSIIVVYRVWLEVEKGERRIEVEDSDVLRGCVRNEKGKA